MRSGPRVAERVETRRIERRLARRWLPPALDSDRKQGFSVPLDTWFREAGPEAVHERLVGLPEVIDGKMVEVQICGHLAGRANGARLFALVGRGLSCSVIRKGTITLRILYSRYATVCPAAAAHVAVAFRREHAAVFSVVD